MTLLQPVMYDTVMTAGAAAVLVGCACMYT